MEFTILTAENYKTMLWSGGKTTQLYIYPPTANYEERDFDFRLSTAKVETEKSDFTSLPGVSRKIMVLEGEMLIHHENHHCKKLNKFEMDKFEGDWKTSSKGKCSDFNLMTRNETFGELLSVEIKKNKYFNFSLKEIWNWLFVYAFDGKISIEIDTKTQLLNRSDLLIISKAHSQNIRFQGIENSQLIFTKIALPISK